MKNINLIQTREAIAMQAGKYNLLSYIQACRKAGVYIGITSHTLFNVVERMD